MSIGYACIAMAVENTQQRTIIQKNVTEDKLTEIIRHNLQALEHIFAYNLENNIKMFRISSDIIPFGSSPVNTLPWTQLFAEELAALGKTAMDNGMRLSMHPGQYTVLNSPSEEVVCRAVEDLTYHCALLDAMGLPPSHKLVLHIGGVYGDKKTAMERFVANYQTLSDEIKKRLILENDDRSYTVEEVLEISHATGAPVVFDNLHHRLNPPPVYQPDAQWIAQCYATWKEADGRQKMHYSQQAEGQKLGSHSATIAVEEFLDYFNKNAHPNLDIMLEVKDKNLSAIKCILATSPPSAKTLEQEWARYKYLVLEHSHPHYLTIRQLLKDKANPPVLEVLQAIEAALLTPPTTGGYCNAAQHVWGYFRDCATPAQAKKFFSALAGLEKGTKSPAAVKKILYTFAQQYKQPYLLSSYYFA